MEEGMSIYERCQEAISSGDSLELARLLGLTYEGETSDKKVYDLSLINLADTDKILENLPK
ncbi:UNVERIFIED_CONTAM: hypothetical protein RF648_18030 [Kocuria sp. CPCC 205274]